jgi:hypothetical protein
LICDARGFPLCIRCRLVDVQLPSQRRCSLPQCYDLQLQTQGQEDVSTSSASARSIPRPACALAYLQLFDGRNLLMLCLYRLTLPLLQLLLQLSRRFCCSTQPQPQPRLPSLVFSPSQPQSTPGNCCIHLSLLQMRSCLFCITVPVPALSLQLLYQHGRCCSQPCHLILHAGGVLQCHMRRCLGSVLSGMRCLDAQVGTVRRMFHVV